MQPIRLSHSKLLDATQYEMCHSVVLCCVVLCCVVLCCVVLCCVVLCCVVLCCVVLCEQRSTSDCWTGA